MLTKKTFLFLLMVKLNTSLTKNSNTNSTTTRPVYFLQKHRKPSIKIKQYLITTTQLLSPSTPHNYKIKYRHYRMKKTLNLFTNSEKRQPNILLKKKNKTKKHTNKTFYKKKLILAPLKNFVEKKNVTAIQHNLYRGAHTPLLENQISDILREFRFVTLSRHAIKLVAASQMLLTFKNTASLAQFIKNVFQKVHYTKHIGYLPLLWYLVTFVIGPQLYNYNCLGVRIVLRGKIGVGGDSRKSTQKFNYGVTSSSSKYVKVHRSFTPIRTKTGAIGLSVTIAW